MQLPFEPRRDIRHAFTTPIGTFEVPGAAELMPKIGEVVLAREKADSGMYRSNKGGWHSDEQLLNWPELQFADLADTFRSAVFHMTAATCGQLRFKMDVAISAWANVNRAGSNNNPHVHPLNHWSGVLYVQTADFSADPIREAGNIEFQDPRGPICMLSIPGQVTTLTLEPRQGTILIFPAWLTHWVNTFSVEAVRVSIAFNAYIRRFEPMEARPAE